MRHDLVGRTVAPAGAATPTDFTEEIARCLDRLQSNPRDSTAAERLETLADGWLRAEGLSEPSVAEKTERVALSRWLSHLTPGGKILHLGWREGSMAAALGSCGALVSSHLDHPGRSMAAAVRFGSPRVAFGTLEEVGPAGNERADLLVLETAGPQTVIPLEVAVEHLRSGGWLAVVGERLDLDHPEMVELGVFTLDHEGVVRPAPLDRCGTRLHLFRRIDGALAESPTPDRRSGEPHLSSIIRRRRDESEAERALQAHAAGVHTLPVAPQELINRVGGGTPSDFDRIGLINTMQLMVYCRLEPTDRVLEPGCGCGRNARHLAAFLDTEKGFYHGFDVHEGVVRWADETITSRYPNVRFGFADIHNTNYNPRGRARASEFVFPYESDSFDVVFMPSVFTHMTRDELQHYVGEIHRVLKSGGRLLSWHFLLDGDTRQRIVEGRSTIPFEEYDAVSWVKHADNPCAAIAYDEAWLLDFYESAGLRPQAVIRGSWSGREAEGFKDYQDRVLAVKTEA